MKTVFIFVLFQTPKDEVERIKREIKELRIKNCQLIFIDNTKSGAGYAVGVNKGIRRAIKKKADIFAVCNPDISLKGLSGRSILQGAKYFDIWGLTMDQNGKKYYGGEIDPWRLSAGLVPKKPNKRFTDVDFVTGSLIFIKKEVINKLGLWYETYGMYYEDVDYCLRARRAGLKVGIDSGQTYKHFETSHLSHDKESYLLKNRLKFFLKYSTTKQKIRELIRLPKTVIEESRFLINFLSLNLSSVFVKLLNFALFLFLIKYFSTGQYGIYTLVWAHIGLLAPLADLGTTSYGIVYLPEQRKSLISDLYSIRLFLSVVVFVATLVLAAVFGYKFPILLYILLTSPIIFSNMFSGTLLIQYSITDKLYKASIVSSIFSTVLISCLIGVIIFTRSLTNIFYGIFAFYILYALINIYLLLKERVKLKFSFNKDKWLSIMKNSFVFVLIGFFTGIYFKSDVFLLNFLKGSREVGIYTAGYKFFEALMFIVASYNISATPAFARLASGQKHNFLSRVHKDIFFLTFVGVAVSSLFYFTSPFLFPYFLKGDYRTSIDIFRIVIFALPFILLSSVFLNSIYVMKKAYMVIYLFAFQVASNIILNFIFIPRYSYFASSYITVITEIINTLVLLVIFKFVMKRRYES